MCSLMFSPPQNHEINGKIAFFSKNVLVVYSSTFIGSQNTRLEGTSRIIQSNLTSFCVFYFLCPRKSMQPDIMIMLFFFFLITNSLHLSYSLSAAYKETKVVALRSFHHTIVFLNNCSTSARLQSPVILQDSPHLIW